MAGGWFSAAEDWMAEAADPILLILTPLAIREKNLFCHRRTLHFITRMLESFNRPELVNGRIKVNSRDFAKAYRAGCAKDQDQEIPWILFRVRLRLKKTSTLK